MKTVSRHQLLDHLRAENPWWTKGEGADLPEWDYRPRAYFAPFCDRIRETGVRRATVLMGPRRVGKTVLLRQAVGQLMADGVPRDRIFYASVDHPLFNNLGLDDFLDLFDAALEGGPRSDEPAWFFFDEIQYMRDWERYLKALVDRRGERWQFTVSGSAAAALRLKSNESGAGRFSEFMLPPLTFHEYLDLRGLDDDLIAPSAPIRGAGEDGVSYFRTRDIESLNAHFTDYLNYGGYPELALHDALRADPARFVKSDIIDKVLLRDLPSLYGIGDIQELNYLFTTLAFNTAGEVSLGELSQNAGIAKNTIKRYIEYLEAAFLLRMVHRLDRNAKRFRRATSFKIYLTNPSIRTALFAPVGESDPEMGSLAETAVFSQWFHNPDSGLFYGRWSSGEIDLVHLSRRDQQPAFAVEVKWTDRFYDRPRELKALTSFAARNNLRQAPLVTTRTRTGHQRVGGLAIDFLPTALYCYTVGRDTVAAAHR